MLTRFIRAAFCFARTKANQSATWTLLVRDAIGSFVKTMQHALLVVGLFAIAALGLMFAKPEIAGQLLALSPFTAAPAEKVAATEQPAQQLTATSAQQFSRDNAGTPGQPGLPAHSSDVGNSRQQQWVTAWLSKRYRVAADATNMLVSATYMTAKEIKLDPLLILLVMAIESRFNPFAESPVGAQGLMQVMSKVHHDKFKDLGGTQAALNPVANIKVGSLILKDYVKRGGSVEAGLKLYVGAGAAESDAGYGAKVLAEYQRLKEVAMGKKVPIYSPVVNAPKPRPQEARAPSGANPVPAADVPAQPAAPTDQFASL